MKKVMLLFALFAPLLLGAQLPYGSKGNVSLFKGPAIGLPSGTTAQRPTGAPGYVRWNTDSVRFEYFNGSKWITLVPGDVKPVIIVPQWHIPIGTGFSYGSTSSFTIDTASSNVSLNIGGVNSKVGTITLGSVTDASINRIIVGGQLGLQGLGSMKQSTASGVGAFHGWAFGPINGVESYRMTLDEDKLRVKTNLYVDTVAAGSSTDEALVIGSDGEVKKVPQSSAGPQWIRITKSYTDFSAAATSSFDIIYSLPAGKVLHAAIFKHSTSFSGGSIASYTLSLGLVGNATAFIPPFDVLQTAAGNVIAKPSAAIVPAPYNMGGTTGITMTATSTGANLSAATQGSVDIYLLISNLP